MEMEWGSHLFRIKAICRVLPLLDYSKTEGKKNKTGKESKQEFLYLLSPQMPYTPGLELGDSHNTFASWVLFSNLTMKKFEH